MARHPRLHVPGGFYHVTLRGNHQQPIFFRLEDRGLLDQIVAESINLLRARVHAYCWMTNHLHLLVQVGDRPLWRLMLRVASSYARKVQYRLDTTGHLFERRYHAALIDSDRYLLAVIRYIHLNPVEAGLVADPLAWPWSSHGVYLGKRERPWVTTGLALGMLAPESELAATRYTELVSGPDPVTRQPLLTRAQPGHLPIIGDDDFAARLGLAPIRKMSGKTLDQLTLECCRRFQVTPIQLSSRSRNRKLVSARAWLVVEAINARAASVCAIARHLGRSEAAIRHLMKRRSHERQDE